MQAIPQRIRDLADDQGSGDHEDDRQRPGEQVDQEVKRDEARTYPRRKPHDVEAGTG